MDIIQHTIQCFYACTITVNIICITKKEVRIRKTKTMEGLEGTNWKCTICLHHVYMCLQLLLLHISTTTTTTSGRTMLQSRYVYSLFGEKLRDQ